MSISYLSVCSTWNRKFKKRVGRTVHGSPLALDNWEQNYCQPLGNKPNHSPVCCEDYSFPRENLNYLIVCFTQCTLLFPKSLFSVVDLFAVRFCGSCVTKINAVLWHSERQTFASLGLFMFALIAFLFQLWIKTGALDYFIWAKIKKTNEINASV